MTGNPEGKIICPHCLLPVGEDGLCPKCGRKIRENGWLIEFADHEWFDLCGEVSPCRCTRHYWEANDGRVDEETRKNFGELEVEGGLPVSRGSFCLVGNGADRLNTRVCILGDGVDDRHAVLFRRDKGDADDGWWICHCAGMTGSRPGKPRDGDRVYAGTFVNRRRVLRLRRLEDGDRIGIAGVELLFDRGKVRPASPRSERAVVTVEGVSAAVGGTRLLENVGFAPVKKGELVGIFGPSGCGKSSLLQRIAGLAKFSGGTINVDGGDLDGEFPYGDAESKSVYLPQNVEVTLHNSLKLRDEVRLYSRIYGTGLSEADSVLRHLHLDDKLDSVIGQFSGGQKRRVGIALALMRSREVLLLDEPCAGLDPASAASLMEYLYRLAANRGIAILCVTHVLDNIDVFDKALVLREGGIVDFYGTPREMGEHYHCENAVDVYPRLVRPNADAAGNADRLSWRARLGKMLRAAWEEVRETFSAKYFRSAFKRDMSPGGGFSDRFRAYLGLDFRGLPLTSALNYAVQPLLVVVCLRFACAHCFQMNGNSRVMNSELLDFCAVLSVFWMGINNTAREFVKERVPGRCLERLAGVPMLPYVLSKFAWMGIVCAAQCLLFTLYYFIAGLCPVCLDATHQAYMIVSPLSVIPLFLSSVMGGACGLAISSLAKKELNAIMFVPVVSIPVLLFSHVVMRFETGTNGYGMCVDCVPWVVGLAKHVMPSFHTAEFLSNTQAHRFLTAETGWSLLMTFAYLVAAFAVTVVAQQGNERKWFGR